MNTDMRIMVGMLVGTGLLLSALAIPMILKKIKPNGLYGFRVRKTMENPEIWYAVNAYSGKWLFGTGLVEIAAAIGLAFVPSLTLDVYAYGVLAVFAIAFAVSLIVSVRYMNSL
jgi:uncharacterized membrane protein